MFVLAFAIIWKVQRLLLDLHRTGTLSLQITANVSMQICIKYCVATHTPSYALRSMFSI